MQKGLMVSGKREISRKVIISVGRVKEESKVVEERNKRCVREKEG